MGPDVLTLPSETLILAAPAKINLTLDVLGRRADGYHTLRSVMQTLDLHDTLELRPCTEPRLAFGCDDVALQTGDNLVVRAARLLREATGHSGGAHIQLSKRIPTEAGLGGGSSDAAATLLGLNKLWGLGLAPGELTALAQRLGSDVPFFLYAPTALVAGRGEVVEALTPPPPVHVVLLKPPVGVSTARLFGAMSPERYGDGSGTERLLAAQRAGLPPARWPLSNGLQETVSTLYPEVTAALEHMRAAGAEDPIMTGSGSTVYALFEREEEARAVYARLSVSGRYAFISRTAGKP